MPSSKNSDGSHSPIDEWNTLKNYVSKCFKGTVLVCSSRGILTPNAIACVASVSNRVIARNTEWKQKKVFVPLPLPRHSFFFWLLSQLSRRTSSSRGNACYAGYKRYDIHSHNTRFSQNLFVDKIKLEISKRAFYYKGGIF